MQASRSFFSAFLPLILCANLSLAQTKAPLKLDPKPASTPQGMEGGLWRTDQDFESVLYLKNVLTTQAITATPTIYMADGTPFDLAPITLDPAGVATININRSLQALPPALQAHLSTFGMVGVRYQWSWAAAILATVRNVDEVAMVSFESSLASDVNTAHAAVTSPPVQQQEALWWKATTDSLALATSAQSELGSELLYLSQVPTSERGRAEFGPVLANLALHDPDPHNRELATRALEHLGNEASKKLFAQP